MSGLLKRKFAEVDKEEEEDPCYPSPLPSPTSSSEWESDGESSSSDNQDFTPSIPTAPVTSLPIRPILKMKPSEAPRPLNAVRFDLVTVYLFPRCQSFTSVPSRGGATLGMAGRHIALRRYTLAEHAVDRLARRRERLRVRLKQERLEALRNKLVADGAVDPAEADRLATEDLVADEDVDAHVGDAELQEGGFLYPYSSKQRQALLKAAGVKRIDREEKRQLHALRLSRDDCGCDCQGFCEPETCACSLAGIKCQMDRSSFPCGCSKDGCANPKGRVEFNSRRVQTHYLHTIMRLDLERRLQDDTPRHTDQRTVPEDDPEVQDDQDHQQQAVQEKTCPFGFTEEEDGLSLTVPATPTFHFSPELAMVGESSYSSDMTDSSCSSAHSEDSDGAGSPQVDRRHLLEEDDGGLARMLDLCEWENEDCSVGSESEARNANQQPYQYQRGRRSSTYADTDNSLSSSLAEYLDENANQATGLFAESPLQDYPNTPSPTIHCSTSYMDLSLSSESDLELFDNFPDCGSGPLHNSFKGHTRSDNFQHLRLLSPPSLPKYDYEHSTCLLESLIGLSEPIPEPPSSFTDNQLFEMVQ